MPEATNQYGIERVYDTYDGVLEDPEVTQCTSASESLHRSWSLKALVAGKHVLCEKPLACSAGEAREMAHAAAANRRLLMRPSCTAFIPGARNQSVSGCRRTGRAAKRRAAFTYAMAPRSWSPRQRRLKAEMGGGALLDVGCYAVSTARWLLGREPFACRLRRSYRHGVDVHIAGILRFPGGAFCRLRAGFVSALQQTYNVWEARVRSNCLMTPTSRGRNLPDTRCGPKRMKREKFAPFRDRMNID